MREFSTAVERGKSLALTLGIASLASAAIEIAISLGLGAGSGQLPPFSYLVLCAILGLGISIAMGFLLGAIGARLEIAVALWVILNVPGSDISLRSILLGVSIWLLLYLSKRFLPAPALTGMRAGVAAGIILVLWPTAIRLISVTIQSGQSMIFHPAVTRIFSLAIQIDQSSLPVTSLFLAAGIFAVLCIVGGTRRNILRAGAEWTLISLLVLMSYEIGYEKNHFSLDLNLVPAMRTANPDAPDVLLIVLDTLRTDRMSLYGYERPTTPKIDAFVARHENAIVYPLAFTNASWTVPAHASLFTGLLPTEHGVHLHGDRTLDGRAGEMRRFGVASVPSLAQKLRAAGYITVGGIANRALSLIDGIGRGFHWWIYPAKQERLKLLGEKVRRTLFRTSFAWAYDRWFALNGSISNVVLNSLEGCGTHPCFVFANYMDTHAPYIPPPPHAGMFARENGKFGGKYYPLISESEDTLLYLSDRYDENLRALDAGIGDLLEKIEAGGLLSNTWIIITSDHGESWGEHGVVDHGTSLYNEQVSIPLIIKPPRGIKIPQIDDPVSLVDVTATIAEIATGQKLGNGTSLLELSATNRVARMQYFGNIDQFRVDDYAAMDELMRASVAGSKKLIDMRHRREIYDIEKDFAEKNDLSASTSPTDLQHLTEQLPKMPRQKLIRTQTEESMDKNDAEALRALGYLE